MLYRAAGTRTKSRTYGLRFSEVETPGSRSSGDGVRGKEDGFGFQTEVEVGIGAV